MASLDPAGTPANGDARPFPFDPWFDLPSPADEGLDPSEWGPYADDWRYYPTDYFTPLASTDREYREHLDEVAPRVPASVSLSDAQLTEAAMWASFEAIAEEDD